MTNLYDMKKKYAFVLTAAMGLFMVQEAFTNSGGSPSGHSGSPASNNNSCNRAGCHNGPNASGQTVNITTNIPSNGFSENSIYQITVTANNNGSGTNRMGFMASVESSTGHTGAISVSNSSTTRKAGSFITHTSSGINGSGGVNSWTFDWDSEQSPDQSTVYAAVNFTNQNGTTSGDVIVNQSLSLDKNLGIGIAEAQIQKVSAYPNPALDLLTVASSSPLKVPFEALSADGRCFQLEAQALDAQHYEVQVEALPAGIYILQDQAGNQLRFTKQ